MPVPQPPPLRPQSGARRFWFTLGLFAVAGTLLIALLYAEEDLRGARFWTRERSVLQGKGESLDPHRFVPPAIPDDRNLGMAPLFVRELAYRVDPATGTYTFGLGKQRPRTLEEMPFGTSQHKYVGSASYELARPADLTGYQQFFREQTSFPHSAQPGTPAADVLLALTRYGPALNELSRAAAERPLTRFPLDWNRKDYAGMNLSHYHLQQNLVRTLCLRADAEQVSGDTTGAVRDLELGLRLCRDMGREHLLVGHLTEVTTMGMMLGEVWAGVAARRWSVDELARLQADLQAFDLLADSTDALRLERAFSVYGFDYWQRTHYFIMPWVGSLDDPQTTVEVSKVLGWIVPGGWFDANRATVARYETAYAVEAIDVGKHRVFTDRFLTRQPEWKAMQGSVRLAPARFLLAINESILARTARSQTAVDEAATACALERFWFQQRVYPARLDELVPAYLARVPNDVIDGAPLRYRPTPDGRYCLYSVGSNGTDDGGQIAWEASGRHDFERGDWPWQYTELRNPMLGK